MAPRDWSTDCSVFFMRHSCHILSVAFLCAAWYANRLESQVDSMQATLIQIQIAVGVPGYVGPPLLAPKGGVAMVEAE
jgi:hypothetical protein